MGKYYITKYALTDGIVNVDGEISEWDSQFLRVQGYCTSFYKKANEWTESLDEAKVISENKRIKKIASLEKQLDKYKKMKFD